VEETSYCDVDLSLLLDASPRECVAVKRAGEHARLESSGRPSLGSAVLRSTNAITRDRLERLLERWTPATARLKGFVALTDNSHVAVQSCFGDTTITPVEMNTRITEMVAMGAGVESDFFTAYDEENRCNPY
jgi:G3E family GTPase